MTEDVLDDALRRLEEFGPEFRGGLANHAPMVVEALTHIGRADAVMPFVAGTVAHLDPAPPVGRVIPPAERFAALGDPSRYADWYATAADDFGLRPWADALAAWLPFLVGGVFAHLGHGAIRTTHAMRGLERGESDVKYDELHRAVGYWAAGWEDVLSVATLTGPETLDAAFARLADLPVPPVRTFADRKPAMQTEPGFAAALRALGIDGTSAAVTDHLTAGAARMLILNPAGNVIFLVHGVTLAGAVRALLPYLGVDDQRRAVAGLWESIAATIFISGARPDVSGDPFAAGTPPPWIQLIDEAIETGDEHAIKFTVAAFDADQRRTDPIFAAAAASVIERSR